jgi:hypothetical protein
MARNLEILASVYPAVVPSGSALAIAIGLQLAYVLHICNRPLAAIWLAAPCVAVLVWKWTQRRSQVYVVFANAILLSLPAGVYIGHGGTGLHGAADRARDGIEVDDQFPGVILLPDVQPHAVLVPPLPAMRSDLFKPGDRIPLSIPFFGSYWLYKWPQHRLPKDAVIVRGDPDRNKFRSMDGHALTMEAHQNLHKFIETRCCSAIQIALRDADRYPGSVGVELQLLNTSLKGALPLSLGTLPVTARPSATEMEETLTFPMPAAPALTHFDELTIKFVLARVRDNHSAAIAIERFILIPRHGS